MNALLSSLNTTHRIDARLEQIIEAAIGRLQDDQPIDVEALVAAHPEYGEQLRELLPAVMIMVRLGGATAQPAERPTPTNGHSVAPQHQQLGDFRIIRELGRGGMGMVYEAEQVSMGRHVALKVLPFVAIARENSLQRFRNEVRAAAALDHPHIVSIYSVGEERGVHYYAMQLVRGQTLADLIGELRKVRTAPSPCPLPAGEGSRTSEAATIDSSVPPPSTKRDEQARLSTAADSRHAAEFYRTAAQLGIQAAEALQHAHDQGVLHRDIKPSNLMLDREGELYITDFGLARIEADAGMTMTGDIVGTLRYMAPEQALAKRVVIDHRADIYSLGATLYELLTLQPAFGETDRSELLKQIAFEEPRPLRRIDRHIPAELETIVLKAMAKNPEERYETAQRLADDLQAFLDDRPIQAKPPTLLNRTTKWSRRHVAVVWSAAVVLLISTIVLTVASLQVTKWYREAEHQREFASSQLKEAQKQEKSARAVSDFLQQMLASANPDQIAGKNYTVRQLLDDFSGALGEQLANQPEVEGTLRATVGKAFWRLGLHDQAEAHFKSALELRRNALGRDHVLVGDILVDYAWNLHEAGKLGEAITSVKEGLVIYRRNGTPRESTLNALRTLHRFLVWIGEFREADATADEALALAGDLDAVETPAVASLLHGISGSKLLQGDYAAAELVGRQAVVLHRRLHGDQHPETAWGLTNLGLALEEQQKLLEAEAAQREALAIFRRHYGAEHKSIQLVNGRLAQVLRAKGDWTEFESVVKEAIAGHDEAIRLGRANADSCNQIAWLLVTVPDVDAGNSQKAVQLAQKAVELAPMQGTFWNTLGVAHYRAGDWQAAIDALQKSIELRGGGDSYDWFFLAMAHHQLGNQDEARDWHKRAVEWNEQNSPVSEDLVRFRAEAAALLGLTAPVRPGAETPDH